MTNNRPDPENIANHQRFRTADGIGAMVDSGLVITDVPGTEAEARPGQIRKDPGPKEPYDLTGTLKQRPRCRGTLLDRQLFVYAGPPVRGRKTWGGEFDLVVTLAFGGGWFETPTGTRRLKEPFEDEEAPEPARLNRIIKPITAALSDDRRVAVHCQMGMNRAPFIAALTARQYLGLSGQRAIWYVRVNHELPRQALSNRSFCQAVTEYEGDERP